MRYYEEYAKEPDVQMALFGEGEDDLKEAEAWMKAHPLGWQYIISHAIADANKSDAKLSMRDYVCLLRVVEHVPCRNAITPALARIAERDHAILRGRFTKSRAKVDGFVS